MKHLTLTINLVHSDEIDSGDVFSAIADFVHDHFEDMDPSLSSVSLRHFAQGDSEEGQ